MIPSITRSNGPGVGDGIPHRQPKVDAHDGNEREKYLEIDLLAASPDVGGKGFESGGFAVEMGDHQKDRHGLDQSKQQFSVVPAQRPDGGRKRRLDSQPRKQTVQTHNLRSMIMIWLLNAVSAILGPARGCRF